MSREIKFRAWCHIPCFALDKSTWIGKMMMCVVSSLNIKTGKARVLFTRENGEKSYETIDVSKSELMQWTGQEDSRGTDTYEGDICEMPYGDRFLVVFNKGSFTGEINNSFIFGNVLPGEFKVIGNIHENPELLNGD